MTAAKPKRAAKRPPRVLTCQRPDRDVQRLVCDYPLPCPFHTIIIDATAKPVPTVTIPATSNAMERAGSRLRQIAKAVAVPERPERPRRRKRGRK